MDRWAGQRGKTVSECLVGDVEPQATTQEEERKKKRMSR